jgi:hypothetical protein
MPANSEDKLKNRVLETANRLRLIQVDFADESKQTRTEYLCEEIERALKTVLPQERHEFLEGLMAKFPAGQIGARQISKEPPAESDLVIDEDRLNDADFLAGRLSEILPALSSDRKEHLAGSLHQAGLPTQGTQNYSPQMMQELMTQLQLGDERPLDNNRLIKLITLLTDFACKLEPLVWNTWRKLSPRSSIRPSGALKKTMGQFASSDSGAPRQEVDSQIKQLQRLIAAIITAVSRVGSQFAKHHLARFSPSEIETLVRMEHGSVFVSHEVKCWRKYLELAGTLNEDSIETEIRKAIVDCVESLMKGMGQQR